MCETEKLIYLVRERPFLYDMNDPEYKNRSKRIATWKEIAVEMGSGNGDTWSAKWKSLKDNFAKYKKSSEPPYDENYKKYKNWPWVDQMRFLDDCNCTSGRRMRYTPSRGSNAIADDNSEDSNDTEQEVPMERSTRKRRHQESPEASQEQGDRPKGYRVVICDETDELFLSYAQILKRMPKRMQIILKLELSTLFSRYELLADGASIDEVKRIIPNPVKLESDMFYNTIDE